MKFEALKIVYTRYDERYEYFSGEIFLNNQIYRLKNTKDYLNLKNTKNYKQFIKELTLQYIKEAQFEKAFSQVLNDIFKETLIIKLDVPFSGTLLQIFWMKLKKLQVNIICNKIMILIKSNNISIFTNG